MAESHYPLETLVQEVQKPVKYQAFKRSLVQKIAEQEYPKHSKLTAAVKAVRTRLHQVSGAFLANRYNYAQLGSFLEKQSQLSLEEQKPALLEAMRLHASTQERLHYLDSFYRTCLEGVGAISSVLDLACGLNPLSLPWMPLSPGFRYDAWDVVTPLLSALQTWFDACGLNAATASIDITEPLPTVTAQLTLLLKTIPILDQIDPAISLRLLAELQTPYILVSFPARSLGGHRKGMPVTYTQRMNHLLSALKCTYTYFEFPNELVWLIDKGSQR